ncbi:hypothetical protein LINPERHAP2_LOCUS6020, partial [Linum perenne]
LSFNTLSLKLSWKPPPHPHHQSPIKLQSPSFPLKFKPLSIHSNSSFISRLPQSRNGGFVRRAVEESQEQTVSEQLSESKAKPEVRPSDTPREQGGEQEINDLGAEIRKAMMEKKKEEKAGLMREGRPPSHPFPGTGSSPPTSRVINFTPLINLLTRFYGTPILRVRSRVIFVRSVD